MAKRRRAARITHPVDLPDDIAQHFRGRISHPFGLVLDFLDDCSRRCKKCWDLLHKTDPICEDCNEVYHSRCRPDETRNSCFRCRCAICQKPGMSWYYYTCCSSVGCYASICQSCYGNAALCGPCSTGDGAVAKRRVRCIRCDAVAAEIFVYDCTVCDASVCEDCMSAKLGSCCLWCEKRVIYDRRRTLLKRAYQ